jgi:hypothetical protein
MHQEAVPSLMIDPLLAFRDRAGYVICQIMVLQGRIVLVHRGVVVNAQVHHESRFGVRDIVDMPVQVFLLRCSGPISL